MDGGNWLPQARGPLAARWRRRGVTDADGNGPGSGPKGGGPDGRSGGGPRGDGGPGAAGPPASEPAGRPGPRAPVGDRARPASAVPAEADGGPLGDAGRFEGLVAEHSGALHGYLARRAPQFADDLLAEVWLRAFAGRAGYDPARGTVRVWLFGVARHVLAAHWRGQDRGPGASGALSARAHAEPYADPWQAVDQRLDAAAVAPLIRRTLNGLPHVERELLLLVAWEQLTPAEAALVLGVPQGTARSRLHRARARLRAALAEDSPEDTGTTALTGTTGERT